MGNHQAIGMDEKCTIDPHSGATCMKLQYRAKDGFGGIVWQDPANDWGEAPGGHDLSGAKKLTFWAKGENGGESVTFKMGVLGKTSPSTIPTARASRTCALTKGWKQYEIDVAGKDLSCIKTGFVWVVGAKGAPITFYLDDIRYE
jgi:hypothetical protein